jgi:endonuclease YncB( thermonuclease family)
MWTNFLTLLCVASGGLLEMSPSQAQKPEAKPPLLDFSNDPCGNPLMESSVWASIEGKISAVVDGRTIAIIATSDKRRVTVHLAGIGLKTRGRFAEAAKSHLQKLLLDKSAEVVTRLEVKGNRQADEVTGVIRAGNDPV